MLAKWANAPKTAQQKSSSRHHRPPNHPAETGDGAILQRFSRSLGNHLILLVVCRFLLVLGNFAYRQGYSSPAPGTRCRRLSQPAAAPRAAPRRRGTRGCAGGRGTQNRQIFCPGEPRSIPPLLALPPDVARMCASGAASLGGDEKRVMRRSDMLNFPPRWCSHNNVFPADGVHVSLPFHWSSVTQRTVVRACVHLLFPEPSLPFWGGRGAWPSVVSLRKTLSQ